MLPTTNRPRSPGWRHLPQLSSSTPPPVLQLYQLSEEVPKHRSLKIALWPPAPFPPPLPDRHEPPPRQKEICRIFLKLPQEIISSHPDQPSLRSYPFRQTAKSRRIKHRLPEEETPHRRWVYFSRPLSATQRVCNRWPFGPRHPIRKSNIFSSAFRLRLYTTPIPHRTPDISRPAFRLIRLSTPHNHNR